MLRPWSFHIDIPERVQGTPLYSLIADRIREQIINGSLSPGQTLPGSREMASSLNVNRKTIVRATSLLIKEGYLFRKERVGLFVSGKGANKEEDGLISTGSSFSETTSQRVLTTRGSITVNGGTPDTTVIPYARFSMAYRHQFNLAAKRKQLGYADPLGSGQLRQSIVTMLNMARGMNVTPECVIITRGSQMALFLITHAILEAGSTICMENPGYQWAYETFQSGGVRVLPIPVDEHGIRTDILEESLKNNPSIKAVYLTPRHQYPTTVTLTMGRRKHLEALVKEYDFLVIEDDFSSDFRFGPHHQAPLCAKLQESSSLYIGTFSKMFAPAIRLGFIVAPGHLIDRLGSYRRLMDMQGDIITERTMSFMMENGELKSYLRQASSLYQHKLSHISSLIETQLTDYVDYQRPSGGLAVFIRIRHTGLKAEVLDKRLREQGITFRFFYEDGDGRIGLRIGYASLSISETEVLIMKLRLILERLCSPYNTSP